MNLCGDDGSVERACNALKFDDTGDVPEDDFVEFYKLLGCDGINEVLLYGFECQVLREMECKDNEKELLITFQTDYHPGDSSILVFLSQGEEDYLSTIEKLDLADRTIATEQITEFSIPENGLADLRFRDPEKTHVLSSCLPISNVESCVQVIIQDVGEDGISSTGAGSGKAGYEVKFGDDYQFSGGGDDEFDCKLYHIGPGCPTDTEEDGEGGDGSSQCERYEIEYIYPKNVAGGDLPQIRDKEDFFQLEEYAFGTLAVTVDAFVTEAPDDSPV